MSFHIFFCRTRSQFICKKLKSRIRVQAQHSNSKILDSIWNQPFVNAVNLSSSSPENMKNWQKCNVPRLNWNNFRFFILSVKIIFFLILQSEIEKAAKQTGISSAVKLAIVTPSGLPESSTGEYIPEVEWWDEVVLGNGKWSVWRGKGLVQKWYKTKMQTIQIGEKLFNLMKTVIY